MIKLAKSIYKFFDSISSETQYWKQLQKLQSELEATRNQLAELDQQSYNQIIEISDLTDRLEDARSEIADSKAAYQSLLFDYFEMTKKHRQYKMESLEELQETNAKLLKLEEYLSCKVK